MARIDLRNNIVTSLKKILRELKKKYKELNIDEFRIESQHYSKFILTWKHNAVWHYGEPFRKIEINLLKLSTTNWRPLGKCVIICCKLKKIEKS